jgi:hypothetical protein
VLILGLFFSTRGALHGRFPSETVAFGSCGRLDAVRVVLDIEDIIDIVYALWRVVPRDSTRCGCGFVHCFEQWR